MKRFLKLTAVCMVSLSLALPACTLYELEAKDIAKYEIRYMSPFYELGVGPNYANGQVDVAPVIAEVIKDDPQSRSAFLDVKVVSSPDDDSVDLVLLGDWRIQSLEADSWVTGVVFSVLTASLWALLGAPVHKIEFDVKARLVVLEAGSEIARFELADHVSQYSSAWSGFAYFDHRTSFTQILRRMIQDLREHNVYGYNE